MTGPGGQSASWIPKLSIEATSVSIRRFLTSLEDWSPKLRSFRKVSTPRGLPVLSDRLRGGNLSTAPTDEDLPSSLPRDSSSIGGDRGFQWTVSTLNWHPFITVSVTIVVLIVLGTYLLSGVWKASPSDRLTSWFSSTSSHGADQLGLPLDDHHHSQDNSRVGGDDHGIWNQSRNNSRTGGSDDGMGREQDLDEKCWSRTRHWNYRSRERHFPPSPALTRAIQNYATLHSRCTAGKKWESLTELTQKSNNGDRNCKYLVYIEGSEGLGNRFLSLVSAFTYALLTDRVLLVDARRNMSTLICEPFLGSSWNLPSTFPFEQVDQLPTLHKYASDEDIEREPAVRLNLRHQQSARDVRFLCAEVQDRLAKVTLLAWRSNLYYIPRLYTIPQFWRKLTPLFEPDPSLVFTQLSRILLLPRNAIWIKVERIFRAYFATHGNSSKLIGIQVRSPFINRFEQTIFDRVVRCFRDNHHILPKLSSESEPLGLDFNFGDHPEEGIRIEILVTALRREYFDKLREEYIERGAENGTRVSVHSLASEGMEKAADDHIVKAFIDIMLLSFSDQLGTSERSTFGSAAQGMGGIFPHIVNTDVNTPKKCSYGQSIDPCLHYPFLSQCPAPSMNDMDSDHGKWIKKHLRPCQDVPSGIQLVPG